MNKSILRFAFVVFVPVIFFAFTTTEFQTDPKSKSLLRALASVNGGWKKLASKKDVEFTYVYHDFSKGKDVSKERYIFNGEASWGEYEQHEVNILPKSKGLVRQFKKDGISTVTLEGKKVTTEEAIKSADFFRSVNYFWLTMMYKLEDPGTLHRYLGQETVKGIKYDKVSLTYDSKTVDKEVNDEYILYFNPETHLIDQFMFSLPAWGITKPVLRTELDYEVIDGIYLSTKRTIYAPNETGEYFTLGEFTSKDVKFNNGFTVENLKL